MKKFTLIIVFFTTFLFSNNLDAACSLKSQAVSLSVTDTCKTGWAEIFIKGNPCYKYTLSVNNQVKGSWKTYYNNMTSFRVTFSISQNGSYYVCVKVTDTCNNCDTTLCSTLTITCFNKCNWKSRLSQVYMTDTCQGNNNSKINSIAGTIYYATGVNSSCYKYQWSINNVLKGVSKNFNYKVTQNGTYTQCIKITDTCNKCDTTICRNVTFSCFNNCNWKGQNPQFLAGDTCAGTSYNIFSALVFNGTIPGYFKYNYTLNGNPVNNSGSITVTSNGTYTVCIKVTDTIKKCDTTFCKQVVVDCIKACNWKSRTPYVYFNDTCNGNGLRNKIHGYISFTSGGCYKYRWSVNGIPVNNKSGYPFWFIYDVTKNGTYTICVKVTDTCNNCDTSFCATKTFSCFSNCNWKGNIYATYMSDTCRGYGKKNILYGYVNFNNGVNISCYKYEWKINNVLISKNYAMYYNVPQNGIYYQCLKITDTCNKCDTTICRYVTFSCINNSCLWKHSLSMTLKNKCLNNKDTVYATVTNQNTSGCVRYTWLLNGKTVPGNNKNISLIINQNGTYQLCAKVRDTCNNCDTFICSSFTVNCFSTNKCRNWKGKSSWFQVWDSCQSNNSRKNINGYMALDTPGCYKYRWTVNGTPVAGSNNMKYKLTGNGTYYVCVKVTDTCTQCDTTYCSTRTITCFNGCNFKSGNPNFYTHDTCMGNKSKVSGYVSFTNKPCLRYLWTVGGVGVSTSQSFTSYIYYNGNYRICVKVTDTCNKCDTTICTTRTVNCSGLGIKKSGVMENIKVYPNPVDGQLNIDWGGNASQFEITDMTGNLVYKGELTEGKNILRTDVWANGVYMIKVNSETGSRILKIVVSR